MRERGFYCLACREWSEFYTPSNWPTPEQLRVLAFVLWHRLLGHALMRTREI